MLVLGIESTCDETACSVVKDGSEILSNIIVSQINLHAQFGGVVPELSCRRHVDVLIPVIEKALKDAKVSLHNIDLIAVAHGPGLIGALLIGLTAAKTLSLALNKPFVGINHTEAHLYAAMMSQNQPIDFPCMGIILSGGHTALVKMNDVGSYALIGETIDDAIGEAFDKVAKMMDLPYPGGPQIESLAIQGDLFSFGFNPGKVKGRPFDFSFSGLKTAVLYAIKGQNCTDSKKKGKLSEQSKADIAAAFQHAAFKDIISKTLLAAKEHNCNTLIFGGGVTNNSALRQLFFEKAPGFNLLWPSAGLSLDNAAMIAGLGYHVFKKKGKGDPIDLPAVTRIPF